ncbi:polyphenol oxidase family protein [Acidovorax sp. GBBC 3334]|uniref:polyphenol oxidase family protein n=1 Tax=Acidovorax sp. GBBC 3334 TaxID=2940496 RepID=UPI0023043A50|nr:polyphenol oxidase family protein [Acidovorax sp. GBBC 3334]MDA8457403.1 polyphenol oxidase family protein [Acidovorax sp. GBBC 3334]
MAGPAIPAVTGLPTDWLRPDWPAPAHVHALCTTRSGGVSQGPWATFNLGDHVDDSPHAVVQNRQRLRDGLAAWDGSDVVPRFLKQVHGTCVADLDADPPDGTPADACTASLPGRACTIMVADCLPVLFADRQGTRVAAAHAGWRGLAGGVLEQALACFGSRRVAESSPPESASGLDGLQGLGDVLAWLGPCIGPTAFEVGDEVREAFCDQDTAAAAHFSAGAGGKHLASLPGLARQRLLALGVGSVHGNDGSDGWCTVLQSSRFFSHRASMGLSGVSGGRMAACIWIGRRAEI